MPHPRPLRKPQPSSDSMWRSSRRSSASWKKRSGTKSTADASVKLHPKVGGIANESDAASISSGRSSSVPARRSCSRQCPQGVLPRPLDGMNVSPLGLGVSFGEDFIRREGPKGTGKDFTATSGCGFVPCRAERSRSMYVMLDRPPRWSGRRRNTRPPALPDGGSSMTCKASSPASAEPTRRTPT